MLPVSMTPHIKHRFYVVDCGPSPCRRWWTLLSMLSLHVMNVVQTATRTGGLLHLLSVFPKIPLSSKMLHRHLFLISWDFFPQV